MDALYLFPLLRRKKIRKNGRKTCSMNGIDWKCRNLEEKLTCRRLKLEVQSGHIKKKIKTRKKKRKRKKGQNKYSK